MNGEPTAPGAHPPPPLSDARSATHAPPWSAAAAMEPVPPLAPPPARPGAGARVDAAADVAESRGTWHSAVVLAWVLVIVAVVALALVLMHH